MTLELITKSKEKLLKAKAYCKEKGIAFTELEKVEFVKGQPLEYAYNISGTKKQIEAFEDDHNIVY